MVVQQPVSPPARRLRHPSWLDLRLITGVLLVLVSVVLGAKVIGAADRSVRVWALTHDVAAGTALAAGDLRPARVRLFDSAEAYLQVFQSPAGRTVTRALHEGELLPRRAVVATPPGALVSIPVEVGNAPGLARGDLIDVWSTIKGCLPVLVLARVPVQEVHEGGGALSVGVASVQVIVRVAPAEARRLVVALTSESAIRLVVLDGDLPPTTVPPAAVERCAPIGGQRGTFEPSPSSQPSTATPPIAVPDPSTAPRNASGPTPPASAAPTSGGH